MTSILKRDRALFPDTCNCG